VSTLAILVSICGHIPESTVTFWCCTQYFKLPVVSTHERGTGASSMGKEENPNGFLIYQRGSLLAGIGGGG